MSADDRSFAPPHELVGPVGQVVDVGGGFVPGLLPAPVPGALGTTTPGLATAAIAPAPTPKLGPDDPGSVALAIARLASELGDLFPGLSVAPVPAPAGALTASHATPPGSPGIAPALAPAPAGSAAEPLAQAQAGDASPAALAGAAPGLARASVASSPFAAPPVFGAPGLGAPPAAGLGFAAPVAGAPAFAAPAPAAGEARARGGGAGRNGPRGIDRSWTRAGRRGAWARCS